MSKEARAAQFAPFAALTGYEDSIKESARIVDKQIILSNEDMNKISNRLNYIKENIDTEVEVFIHGAMCTSYSGRCVLSNYVTKRDSNRGGCAQVCRFVFDAENTDKIFSMTPKDLNMISNIEEMINIGVNSFKVEGRMRSVYYIATVINVYRHLIDKIVNKTLDDAYTKYSLSVLNRCANRDSTEQFFNGLPGVNEQYFLSDRDEVSNKDFLGIVDEYNEENYIKHANIINTIIIKTETRILNSG